MENAQCFLQLSDRAYVSCSFFNSKFKPETDWKFVKTLNIHVHASNWTSRSMLTVEPAVTCWLCGELIAPHQTKLIDSFVTFAAFRPMAFHFAQAKQKWKNYRDQGRLTYSAPPHQTSPRWIPSVLNSLFAAHTCAPKCEPACRLELSQREIPKICFLYTLVLVT